jgi:hypothetical protein
MEKLTLRQLQNRRSKFWDAQRNGATKQERDHAAIMADAYDARIALHLGIERTWKKAA